MSRLLTFALALLCAHTTLAQTSTDCNPLNSTCPNDPALGTTYESNFNGSQTQLDPNFWNTIAGAELISFGKNGTQFTIARSGDSVTAQSLFYIFWGQVEVIMQAAAGTGIISTLNLLSDDLDEIDLEIMGGNTSFVESNYFGWGNQSQQNALYHRCDGPQQKMHNYTIQWNQQQIQWFIDGSSVRTVPYAGPGQYPQTPSYLKVGVWAAGDPSQPEGRIQWAGGKTDYSKGPFAMTVASIKVTDGSTNTSSYLYGDNTGSYQSIKSVNGESKAYKAIHHLSLTQQAVNKFNGLSTGAKIGIACGVLGFVVLLVICWTVFCITQRKKGRQEKALVDKEFAIHQTELMEYRERMKRGEFAVTHLGHGEKF